MRKSTTAIFRLRPCACQKIPVSRLHKKHRQNGIQLAAERTPCKSAWCSPVPVTKDAVSSFWGFWPSGQSCWSKLDTSLASHALQAAQVRTPLSRQPQRNYCELLQFFAGACVLTKYSFDMQEIQGYRRDSAVLQFQVLLRCCDSACQ